MFAQARDDAASAEELLVDDGWQMVEAEPEAVVLNGNGTNVHQANDSGLSEKLVLGSDNTAAVPVNGNGHPEAPDAPQLSLFSWAKLMAEPPSTPTGRRRKAQAPALLCSSGRWNRSEPWSLPARSDKATEESEEAIAVSAMTSSDSPCMKL